MRTLIFDFDGTLADSFALALDIAYELTGATHLTKKEIDHLRQLPLAKVVKELHIPLLKVPRLLLLGRQVMHDRIKEIKPFDGINTALRQLHDAGYHLLVISSNSEQNVRLFLRNNGLESYFDGVYGGASIFNKATALKKVLKKNKLTAQECFYIGDEVRDVTAAAHVKLIPIAVTWGYQAPAALARSKPQSIVRQPQDLVGVIRQEDAER